MKYSDFLIEVKTPWMKKEEKYERNIIRYNCIPGSIIDQPLFAYRYLNEATCTKEISDSKRDDALLVHAIDVNTEEEITNPSEFISCLIEFATYQWNYEK